MVRDGSFQQFVISIIHCDNRCDRLIFPHQSSVEQLKNRANLPKHVFIPQVFWQEFFVLSSVQITALNALHTSSPSAFIHMPAAPCWSQSPHFCGHLINAIVLSNGFLHISHVKASQASPANGSIMKEIIFHSTKIIVEIYLSIEFKKFTHH